MGLKEWLHDDRTFEECCLELQKSKRELLEEFAKALGIYKLLDLLESKLKEI
jgi:hypothetical protein